MDPGLNPGDVSVVLLPSVTDEGKHVATAKDGQSKSQTLQICKYSKVLQ